MLGATLEGFHALRISEGGAPYTGVRIAYNSSLQSFAVDEEAVRGLQWVGNVATRERSDCARTQSFSHNVWRGARCSRSDRAASSQFVDPARLDLRLRASSAARRAGDPRDRPRTDHTGRPRPRSVAPDAGAFQR